MISALNLLWIIPLCSFIGFMVCAILSSGARADLEIENITLRKQLEEK